MTTSPDPATTTASTDTGPDVLVRVRGVEKVFERGGVERTVLHDVDLDLPTGATLALVGESGSGKTTLARIIVGLAEATRGSVEIAGLEPREGRRAATERARAVQMVFQDPYASMNPRMRVADIVLEPLRALNPRAGRRELLDQAHALLEQVGIDPGSSRRHPHEFSGGQRQRIAIARAISVKPRLLVLDEPTSALDVSVQAAILELLIRLRAEHRMTCLFVSHNLAVVSELADRIAVMHGGRIVEEGPCREVLDSPASPYTRSLVDAVPSLDPRTANPRHRARSDRSGR